MVRKRWKLRLVNNDGKQGAWLVIPTHVPSTIASLFVFIFISKNLTSSRQCRGGKAAMVIKFMKSSSRIAIGYNIMAVAART